MQDGGAVRLAEPVRYAVAAVLLLASQACLARDVRGAPAGNFDLYLLALSWSPGFCASGGEDRAGDQCAPGSGLGFVVHGLWPQYERGYPTYCGPQGRSPQRRDLDAVAGVMPSVGLARYQWRKHGSCSGLAPSGYFRAVAAAYAKVRIPPAYQGAGPQGPAEPLAIERAFALANPGLRPDMITVGCGRSDSGPAILQEVRICLTRDLREFRRCPDEVERATCRARSIDVPEVR
jgi:ribonuclease T2